MTIGRTYIADTDGLAMMTARINNPVRLTDQKFVIFKPFTGNYQEDVWIHATITVRDPANANATLYEVPLSANWTTGADGEDLDAPIASATTIVRKGMSWSASTSLTDGVDFGDTHPDDRARCWWQPIKPA